MDLRIDSTLCCACRACELACSFHHAGVFSPALSSIQVFQDNQNGEVIWSVDASCDRCSGEKQALCVEYCAYRALKEVGRDGYE